MLKNLSKNYLNSLIENVCNTINRDFTIESVINHFLSVSRHDPFDRSKVEWVVHSWC